MMTMLQRLMGAMAVSTLLMQLYACSGSSSGPVVVAETCFDLSITIGTSASNQTLCTTNENGQYNGLGVYRFARFTLNTNQSVTITANRISGNSPADPDLFLYRNGHPVNWSLSVTHNRETMTTSLVAGDYVVELYEYNYHVPDFKLTSQQDKYLSLLQTKTSSSELQITTDKLSYTGVMQAVSNCPNTPNIIVSGNASYERVPNSSGALDYNNIVILPIRGAVVEVICNDGTYAATTTDVNGNYSINAPLGAESFIRVSAQMIQIGAPSWGFSVVDNTRAQALYVMDGSPFNEVVNITRNLIADSGWTGNGYGNPRVAAPFAILDSVYEAYNKILDVDSSTVFPVLKLNWSINNFPISGDRNLGQITTTHFDSMNMEIYILGAEDVDTDEYDDDVIIHEWGHYFQAAFSRDDSMGGEHGSGDRLDIRAAFSEGFGYAFAAMVGDDPVSSDSSGFQQSEANIMNINSNNCLNAGWYSECSVQSLLYDLYDADINDGADSIGLGLQPIYNVLVNDIPTSPAFISVFSFIHYLKTRYPGYENNIDALVSGQNIDPITDIYGDSELNNNPGATNQLPVYAAY